MRTRDRLQLLADWAEDFAGWLEARGRHPNDLEEPGMRTLKLEADGIDELMNGLLLLPEELRHIASLVERRPGLRIVGK